MTPAGNRTRSLRMSDDRGPSRSDAEIALGKAAGELERDLVRPALVSVSVPIVPPPFSLKLKSDHEPLRSTWSPARKLPMLRPAVAERIVEIERAAAGSGEVDRLVRSERRVELERRSALDRVGPGPADGALEVQRAGRDEDVVGVGESRRDRARPRPAGLLEQAVVGDRGRGRQAEIDPAVVRDVPGSRRGVEKLARRSRPCRRRSRLRRFASASPCRRTSPSRRW